MTATRTSWVVAFVAIGCVAPPYGEPPPEEGAIDVTADEIDLSKCDPAIKCPAPKDCGRDWDDKPRDPAWPACAPPPAGGCSQIVLGRFDDMKKYLGCPGYITLNLAAWTPAKNDEFIGCANAGALGATCSPPILIASPDGSIPDSGSQTSIELCQLNACKCKVETKAGGTGKVTACPAWKKAKKGTKKKGGCSSIMLVAQDGGGPAPADAAPPPGDGAPPPPPADAGTQDGGSPPPPPADAGGQDGGSPPPPPDASTGDASCTPVWSCASCDPESDDDCAVDVEMCGCEECAEDDTDPACGEFPECQPPEML